MTNAPTPAKPVTPAEETQAEKNLTEETEKAKNQLVNEIKQINFDDGVANKDIDSEEQ